MNNGLPKGVQPTGGGPEKGTGIPAQLPTQDGVRPLGPSTSPLAEPGTAVVRRTPPPGQTRPVSDLVLPQAASTPRNDPTGDAATPDPVPADPGAADESPTPGDSGRRGGPPPIPPRAPLPDDESPRIPKPRERFDDRPA